MENANNIKNKESLSIKDIFSFKGEDYFRKIEEIECLKIIQDTGKIIAFGGGTFMNETVRNKMKNTCFSVEMGLVTYTLNHRQENELNSDLNVIS